MYIYTYTYTYIEGLPVICPFIQFWASCGDTAVPGLPDLRCLIFQLAGYPKSNLHICRYMYTIIIIIITIITIIIIIIIQHHPTSSNII